MNRLIVFILLLSIQLKSQNVLDGIYLNESCFSQCSDMEKDAEKQRGGSAKYNCIDKSCLNYVSFSYSNLSAKKTVFKLREDTSKIAAIAFSNDSGKVIETQVFNENSELIRTAYFENGIRTIDKTFKDGKLIEIIEYEGDIKKSYDFIKGLKHLFEIEEHTEQGDVVTYLDRVTLSGLPYRTIRVKGAGVIKTKHDVIPKGEVTASRFHYHENGNLAYSEILITTGVEQVSHQEISYFQDGKIQFFNEETCEDSPCVYEEYELNKEGFEVSNWATEAIAPIRSFFSNDFELEFYTAPALPRTSKSSYFDHLKVFNDSISLDFIVYQNVNKRFEKKINKQWKSYNNCHKICTFHPFFIIKNDFHIVLSPFRCWPKDYSKKERELVIELLSK